ncbi:S8 family serine peptidase [Micromonospora sp. NPDC005163]
MLRRPHRRQLARLLVSAGAAIALAATSLATGTAAQAAGAGATSPSDKIRPDLAKQLEAKSAGDFWIHFKKKADLSKASAIKDWNERGTAVAAALKKTAAESQAKIRGELDSAGAKYQTFWATNAIKVSRGSLTMAQKFAGHDEVDGLFVPMEYKVPEVTEGQSEKTANALEWGIANINADDVWSQYGVDGAGITVANIDTGVQFGHPALVNSYRGNNGDGTFDHNYNWFDAAGTCGATPCDNNGHGTHTMGTMAGANQIGVAPGVKWIAANGCCPSDTALFASGQWMLEPTDLHGQNPDASKRPNIINNSWGSTLPSNDPFMEDVTLAWDASGIFGAWSNGNSGPACQTSGSPGSRISTYSAGAYDIDNNIASFSARGSGQDGQIKPNISAPGVNVRSSVPGNDYATYSGTSMAAPHLSGAVALLWSAAPALIGDITATRALLNNTAVDKEDLRCGGTADDNNVYGEGRLDTLALIEAAPIGDTGTLAGTVTDAATGDPIAGATVALTGRMERSLTTGAAGNYSSLLPIGDYQVAVSSFGYETKTVPATVTVDTLGTLNVALTAEPRVTVSGAVTDGSGHGWPLYAKVSVEGSGISDYTTPADGHYSFDLPTGATYRVKVEPQYAGYETVTKKVVVGSDNVTENVSLTVDGTACTAPGYDQADVGGTTSCAPVPGGLVMGTVTDANTDAGVTGAIVTSDEESSTTANSLAEGADPKVGAGFYWLFSALTGEHRFTVAKTRYTSGSATVDVMADGVTTADLELTAGQITVDTDAISKNVSGGEQGTATVSFRNTGTEPAAVRLGERSGAPTASQWAQIPDYPTTIQDNSVGYHDGIVYSVFGWTGNGQTGDMYAYDPDRGSWTKMASPSGPRENAAGEFIDGKFYVTGGWDPSINNVAKLEIYDPSTNTWSTGAPLPKPYANMGHAVLDGKLYVVGGCILSCGITDVQVYDPQTETWTVAASYPEAVSYQACGALGGILYCAGGTTSTGQVRHSYAYDPGTNSWSRIADLPITLSGSGYTVANGLFLVSGGITSNATSVTRQGFAFDPVTGRWTGLPMAIGGTRGGSTLGFYRIGGVQALGRGPVATAQVLAGYDQGESADIPWLAESPTRLTLQPGKKVKVTVTVDASDLPATHVGDYSAEIAVQTNTPYPTPTIPVSMRVAPPKKIK